MRAIYQRRMAQIKREMEEHFDLMKENLNSMEGVFDILVPRNEVSSGESIDFDALMKADYSSAAADTGEKYREVNRRDWQINMTLRLDIGYFITWSSIQSIQGRD